MSSLAVAPERAGEKGPAAPPPFASTRPTTDGLVALAVAAGIVALAFLTSGSSDQTVTAGATWSQIVVVVLGAGAVAVAVLLGARGRAWGAPAVALLAAFTALAAVSIAWSAQPDWSWFGANQLLAYLAAFAGAVALARCLPGRWPALVAAIAVSMTALSAWALLAKVFPASLAGTNSGYGRLQAPFGYWNAVGLAAALGLPACLWAATRPGRGWLLRGLSVPASSLLIAVVVLSYSRSAALAAVVAIACWLAVVPLRLRTAGMLALGALGAAVISAWALARPALTSNGIPLAAQTAAGHTFGWLLLAVLVVMAAAGGLAAWASDRVAVPAAVRRWIGAGLLAGVALVPVIAVIALAASSRGLTGEISHAFSQLSSSRATVTNTSSRFAQVGSSRPLYWHQGLQVGAHALFKGAGELGYGIARLHYADSAAKSDQAHSYLVQTFADLGLLGLALTAALFIAWVIAAARPLALRVRWSVLPEARRTERAGMVALAAVVVAFGIQSALDWTWYFPGVTIPALLAAGWLAGRGPLAAPVGRRPSIGRLRDRPGAGALVSLLAGIALIGAWMMWQPLRSAQELTAAQGAASNTAAFADARSAVAADPLALEPRFELSALYAATGQTAAARAELRRTTQIQPRNPTAWQWLAQFDLQHGRPRAALAEGDRVFALDRSPDPATQSAASTTTAARMRLTHRTARARSRRRHRGGPPARRTTTSPK